MNSSGIFINFTIKESKQVSNVLQFYDPKVFFVLCLFLAVSFSDISGIKMKEHVW